MTAARSRLVTVASLVLAATFFTGCPRRSVEPPPAPRPQAGPARPAPVDEGISDVATGGSWEADGMAGIFRIIVRSGGRRSLRSDVTLQWLRWDSGKDEPVLVKSVSVSEFAQGGVLVTASRIDDDDDGRAVVRLSVANAVTGTMGEGRIWPAEPGHYRAKIKWLTEYE